MTPLAAANVTGAPGALSLVAIVTLIVLLVARDVVRVQQQPWASRLYITLTVAIIPLMFIFGATVALNVVEFFR